MTSIELKVILNIETIKYIMNCKVLNCVRLSKLILIDNYFY